MRKWLPPFLALASFSVAVLVLRHELRSTSVAEILHHLGTVPRAHILVAGGITALDFLPLIGLDLLALHMMGRSLPLRRLAAASFIGYSFSRAIGFAMLSGTAVRYRLCSPWGFGPLAAAKLVAFAAVISWLGFLFLAGTVFLIHPPAVPSSFTLPVSSTRPLGAFFLVLLLIYLVWCARRVAALRIGTWQVNLPTIERALAQVAVASVDWLVAASVPYVLLPGLEVPFLHFAGVYMLAQVAGVLSNVPAGLGVFEIVILLLLDTPDPAATVGALAVYRLVFYIAPLIVAALLFGGLELGLGRRREPAPPAPR